MSLWVRSEENNKTSGKDSFDWIKTWWSPVCKNQRILSLAVDLAEENLALGLANNNIGILSIKSFGLNDEAAPLEVKFDLVCKGFHSGAISAIDVAV